MERVNKEISWVEHHAEWLKSNGRLHWEGRCGQTKNNAPGNVQKHRKEEIIFIMGSVEQVMGLSIIERIAQGC
jgi:hypothetical protein